MSKRALTIPVTAAVALAAGVATAGLATAQESAADAPQVAPNVAKPTSQIVSGYLAPESLQAAIDAGWQAKVEAFAAALKAAEEEAARQAAAAEAARQAAAAAAAQQATATQSSTAQQSYSTAASSSYAGGGDASSWANSGKSLSVKQCESGNNYSTNTGNGYYGAWQFDLPSWYANGGGAYASRPDLAPAWAQDQVAYNYYQSSGWGPWSCG